MSATLALPFIVPMTKPHISCVVCGRLRYEETMDPERRCSKCHAEVVLGYRCGNCNASLMTAKGNRKRNHVCPKEAEPQ